jgi:hypothetical protein
MGKYNRPQRRERLTAKLAKINVDHGIINVDESIRITSSSIRNVSTSYAYRYDQQRQDHMGKYPDHSQPYYPFDFTSDYDYLPQDNSTQELIDRLGTTSDIENEPFELIKYEPKKWHRYKNHTNSCNCQIEQNAP